MRRDPLPPASPDAAPHDFGPAEPHASEDRPVLPAGKRGKQARMASGNRFGLASNSELHYPQAYAPVDTGFWDGLSRQQHAELERLQAIAQEKVGYERGAPKFFIQDFDPGADQTADTGPNIAARVFDPLSEREIVTNVAPAGTARQAREDADDAIPRLSFGGGLIGAGLVAMLLALLQFVVPAAHGTVLALGVASLGAGFALCMSNRR